MVIAMTTITYGQQEISTSQVTIHENTADNPTDWTVYVENSEFRIEYRMSNCDPTNGFDFESVMLKVTNLTSNKLNLSWHKILYYAGTCRTCDYPEEYGYELSLESNQVIEADCLAESGYDLKLFSRFIDAQYSQGDRLTAFQLNDLTVTEY